MAGPWDDYAASAPTPAMPQTPAAPWEAYAKAQPAAPQTEYKGKVLPLNYDTQGNAHLDMSAGIPGMVQNIAKGLWSGATAPGDAYNGKLDPSSDAAIGRAFDLASAVSPVNPAIRAGDKAIPGVAKAITQEKVAPPSTDALYEAAGAGYDKARNLGVDYHPVAVNNMATGLRSGLEQDGVLPILAPKTFSILSQLESSPSGAVGVPFGALDAARKAFGRAAGDFTNPTEQMAAKRVMAAIDDFVTNPSASSVVAGPAAAAADAVKGARGNYAAASRSDRINGIEEAADLRSKAANSGLNADNTIRGRVASLLLNPKQAAGYSADELAALRQVTEGTVGRNAARYIGNILGGGGGLGAALTGAGGAAGGLAAGGPIGAVAGAGLPALGYSAKVLANALTKRSLGAADEAVRTRSPLFQQMQQNAPMVIDSPDQRAAYVRALMMGQQNP
jgi:hypothetical protein